MKLAHLSKLYIKRVAHYAPVLLLVPGIADELGIPHSEVMFPVRPLREDGDGRPVEGGGGTR